MIVETKGNITDLLFHKHTCYDCYPLISNFKDMLSLKLLLSIMIALKKEQFPEKLLLMLRACVVGMGIPLDVSRWAVHLTSADLPSLFMIQWLTDSSL